MALMLSAAKSNNVSITQLVLSDTRELYSMYTNFPGVGFPSLRKLKFRLDTLRYPPPSKRQRAPWIFTCLSTLQELSVEYIVPFPDWRLFVDIFETLRGFSFERLTTLELIDIHLNYKALDDFIHAVST